MNEKMFDKLMKKLDEINFACIAINNNVVVLGKSLDPSKETYNPLLNNTSLQIDENNNMDDK